MAGGMKGKKGKGGKRAARGKRAAKRSKFEVREVASLTEIQAAPTNLIATNTNYSQYNLSLASCTRAQNVAKGYQYYRIKRITYVVKPLMDTFVQNPPGGSSNATVPYLYYMIDRTRQFQAGFTIDQLKAMGAKPRRLDDKSLSFSFTSSVLTDTFDNTQNATTAVQYKLSPWLPTKDIAGVGVWNPNTTDHLGVVWRVEQAVGPNIGYALERRIQFEFKKPAIPTATGLEVPPVDFEDIGASEPAVMASVSG